MSLVGKQLGELHICYVAELTFVMIIRGVDPT